MFIPYQYDPRFHQLVELPVTKYLRRELKRENIVTYHHRVHNTWVVSLKEGDSMLDIGMLGTGEGEGCWCDRDNAWSIIHRMTNLIEAVEANKRLKAWARRELHAAEARQEDYFVGLRKAHTAIKRRRGNKKADEFAARHRTAIKGS